METAPVEYLVLRFPGDRIDERIVPEIGRLVAAGTVHVLDLVFIKRDADGTVHHHEFDDLDEGRALADVEGEVEGVIGSDDIAEVGATLDPGSSALFIVWEDLWASDLAAAVWDAGGELAFGERIPRGAIDAALAAAGAEEST
jgi:hypothetical protein